MVPDGNLPARLSEAELAGTFDPLGAAAAGQAASQPVDSDLSAIAALTTTPFGRSILTLANAAAGRTTLDVDQAGSNIPKTIVNAKGDLLVGTADNALTVLPVGANGRALLPDSAQTSGWRFATTAFFEGTGSPNGVVAAPVGSAFVNSESGGYNGARTWRKIAGTGNTGWEVESGDTGWRNVSSDLTNGWALTSAGFAQVRRIGSATHLGFFLTAGGATAASIYDFPTGFRPKNARITFRNVGTLRDGFVSADRYLVVSPLSAADTSLLLLDKQWPTADAWPASLPGTAA